MRKLYFLGCFLISTLFSVAQNIDLEGTITDTNGTPIMGANIVAVEKETQILDGFGISNEAGYYKLTLKKATDYDIKISFIGLKEVTFVFKQENNLEKNFILEEQPESLEEVELVSCSYQIMLWIITGVIKVALEVIGIESKTHDKSHIRTS